MHRRKEVLPRFGQYRIGADLAHRIEAVRAVGRHRQDGYTRQRNDGDAEGFWREGIRGSISRSLSIWQVHALTRLPPSQWRSARTTNAIERLHEEFKRRIKTQTMLPSADTAAMLFWALLASGQINMGKADGWQTLATKPIDQPIDLAV